jgi:hypothetical protein
MTIDDVFAKTGGAYLALIHPDLNQEVSRAEIAKVIGLASAVSDETVVSLIVGTSWRERLVGLCLALSKEPGRFIQAMLDSMRDPRGLSIVPTCAALAVLAREGIFPMGLSFGEDFSNEIFDGEFGWALQKAKYFAGLLPGDVHGAGPNQGQVFETHFEFYRSILKSK